MMKWVASLTSLDFDQVKYQQLSIHMATMGQTTQNQGQVFSRPTEPHDYQHQASASSTLHQSRKKPIMKPDTFDGSKPWLDYFAHFEICTQLNEWTEKDQAVFLAASLRGAAQQVLGNLAIEERTDFTKLKAALIQRFNPENQTDLYRTQLKTLVRGPEESLPELGQKVRRLVGQSYPSVNNEVWQMLAKEHFLDALTDKEMRLYIQQNRPKTLDEAVQISIEIEASQKAEKQRPAVRKYLREVEIPQYNIEEVAANNTTPSSNDSTNWESLKSDIEELKKMMN